MNGRAYSILGGVIAGFVAAIVCLGGGWSRPATAQINKLTPGSGGGGTYAPLNVLGSNTTTPPPQPIEVQSLDKDHFVVATREPRLVTQLGREGSAQSMLVTVVTHYTVREDRLIPVEHVRVPAGYRAVVFSE